MSNSQRKTKESIQEGYELFLDLLLQDLNSEMFSSLGDFLLFISHLRVLACDIKKLNSQELSRNRDTSVFLKLMKLSELESDLDERRKEISN